MIQLAKYLIENHLQKIPTVGVFYTASWSFNRQEQHMPKYIIEREIPGAGSMSEETLKGISQHSCGVLQSMGPQIQWVESYVTDNKIYCVYIAPTESAVREHAQKGGFPANSVCEVKTIIDPTTAE